MAVIAGAQEDGRHGELRAPAVPRRGEGGHHCKVGQAPGLAHHLHAERPGYALPPIRNAVDGSHRSRNNIGYIQQHRYALLRSDTLPDL